MSNVAIFVNLVHFLVTFYMFVSQRANTDTDSRLKNLNSKISYVTETSNMACDIPYGSELLYPLYFTYMQAASIFMYDKRCSDKMLRTKKKEAVLEMLRADVSRLMQFRSTHILRVLHPVEECR